MLYRNRFDANGNALRSPNTGNSNNVYYVTSSGSSNNNNANNSYGFSLDHTNLANLHLNIDYCQSKPAKAEIQSSTCKEHLTCPSVNHTKAKINRRRILQKYLSTPVASISSDPFSYANLLEASNQCSRGVRWKPSVTKWNLSLLYNINRLYTELHDGTYKMSPHLVFDVYYPKHRLIRSIAFRDRIVQKAMCNHSVYRDLTRDIIYDSGACLKGKGTLFTLDRFRYLLHKYAKIHGVSGWVVQMDIRKFFESIPHEHVINMILKKVKNNLCQKILIDVVNSFPGDRGLGLGCEVSQLLAMSYLSELDHYIKEQLHCSYYIRYSDDLLLILSDKTDASRMYSTVKDKLESMGLVLNPKSTIYPLEQSPLFLKFKYIVFPSSRVVYKASRCLYARAVKRYGKLVKKNVCFKELYNSFNAWCSFVNSGHNKVRTINLKNRIGKAYEDLYQRRISSN